MCLVDRLDVSHAGVDTQGGGAVNAGHGDTVSGLYFVHQVVVGVDDRRVGRLTSRHVVCWRENIFTVCLISIMSGSSLITTAPGHPSVKNVQ